jgi:ABC-2 type transport system ATP-binding protein
MDEAERCHRLAILDRGALVADGTPLALTEALAGRTLVVHAPQPRRAQALLLQQPGVISVAQIGNTLRVLTEANGDAAPRLRNAMAAAGVEGEVESVLANLEDVFVSATRGREEAGVHAA